MSMQTKMACLNIHICTYKIYFRCSDICFQNTTCKAFVVDHINNKVIINCQIKKKYTNMCICKLYTYRFIIISINDFFLVL